MELTEPFERQRLRCPQAELAMPKRTSLPPCSADCSALPRTSTPSRAMRLPACSANGQSRNTTKNASSRKECQPWRVSLTIRPKVKHNAADKKNREDSMKFDSGVGSRMDVPS